MSATHIAGRPVTAMRGLLGGRKEFVTVFVVSTEKRVNL
jgi:hypothetical protein